MASNPPSGSSTPLTQFTQQTKTAEDILKNQTVGLVALSDYRKRRAEAIEQKEKESQDALLSGNSGRGTPGTATPDRASTPSEPVKKKAKKKKMGPKLSFGFGEDDEEGESTEANETSRSATPAGDGPKKKKLHNSSIAPPKALTKAALMKEAQEREVLRKEFLARQELVKDTEINIPFVFYDGTNIPGGVCRIKKGDFVWVFLDRSRKVGAELGVGEKANSRREWARIGVDDLMMVRGSIIIPHHYDFYYFIINHSLGPSNRVLFDYSAEPPSLSIANPPETPDPETYNPLSNPSKAKPSKEDQKPDLEGANDDPTYTKVVDRRWYERNKHIFPASVWQEFDPEKDYQKEVKRDAGGNAFFFS
ncbi:XAP5, circadian clock regulator-domain-containing protein [Bisporella sp. PMI_857]|nr:XAP5, circadian clock regulator-domain-containing protein [Bisporella sp. PMI_857]